MTGVFQISMANFCIAKATLPAAANIVGIVALVATVLNRNDFDVVMFLKENLTVGHGLLAFVVVVRVNILVNGRGVLLVLLALR